jgi:hypothetical protein
MTDTSWYGVRSVYVHHDLQRGQDRLYEERIVLIRATSDEEAIAKAEAEAKTYGPEDVEYLGYLMTYHLFDEPGDMAEVFSLMRESRMAPAYLNRFFDTGRERAREPNDTADGEASPAA